MTASRTKTVLRLTSYLVGFVAVGFLYSVVVIGLAKPLSAEIAMLLPIALLVGTIASTFCLLFPVTALYITLSSTSLEVLGAVGGSQFLTISKLLTVILTVAYTIRISLYPERELTNKILRNPVVVYGFLWLLFSYLSLIHASDFGSSLQADIESTFILVFSVLMILIIKTADMRDKAIFFYTLGLLFSGIVGLFEVFTHQQFLVTYLGVETSTPALGEPGEFRIVGLLNDADQHAMTMTVGIFCALYLITTGRSVVQKLFLYFAIPAFFLNILGSGTRGAMIMLIVSAATYIYLRRDLPRLKISVVGVVLFVIAFLTFSLIDSSGSSKRFTGSDLNTVFIRMQLSVIALRMIEADPIIGTGTGEYTKELTKYSDKWYFEVTYMPHNTALQLWAENGIFQFMLYLGFYGFMIIWLLRYRTGTIDKKAQQYCVFAISIAIGLFIQSLAINATDNQTYWIMYSFLSLAKLNNIDIGASQT